MKLRNYLLLAGLSVGTLVSSVFAQKDPLVLDKELAKQWLVAVEGDTITAGDFWYVFNKNNFKKEAPTQESLAEYRELYTKFLLKVKDAEAAGLDTTPKFIKEFNGYKNQLAESYLKDKKVTENLVKEAYERSLEDVEASHVLIELKYHALPHDTLKAYKKALKVRKEALKGKDFAALAKKYSDDPSSKSNEGYLGFFTAFKMVYPFEDAAYETEVGGISRIIRTRFGYHVIKVHSRRKAVGEIKVAHIMTIVKDDMAADKKKAAEDRINEIYQKLKAGENFEQLARQFSEDHQTKNKGGELPWFGTGKYVPKFENTAFALTEKGAYSQPIKTRYGWHIIKLLDKKDVKKFEEVESAIKNKVARSDRAELSETVVLNRIKKEYNFVEYRKGIDNFYKFCDTTLLNGKWKAPKASKLKEKMFSFAGKTYTQKEFADRLVERLVPRRGGDYRHIVNFSYDQWVVELLKEHEKSQLARKDPDYGRLLKEYRDGIILFELTDQKVWSKAIKDTNGLKDYHAQHADKWKWDDRMVGTVYKCKDEATAKKVRKMLKKKKDDAFILEKINVDSKLNVRVEAGTYQKKDRPEVSLVPKWKKGVSKVFKADESFVVLKIDELIPVGNKTLEEVKGLVTAEYQDYLMKEWLEELSKKYEVVFNEEVYKKLVP